MLHHCSGATDRTNCRALPPLVSSEATKPNAFSSDAPTSCSKRSSSCSAGKASGHSIYKAGKTSCTCRQTFWPAGVEPKIRQTGIVWSTSVVLWSADHSAPNAVLVARSPSCPKSLVTLATYQSSATMRTLSIADSTAAITLLASCTATRRGGLRHRSHIRQYVIWATPTAFP